MLITHPILMEFAATLLQVHLHVHRHRHLVHLLHSTIVVGLCSARFDDVLGRRLLLLLLPTNLELHQGAQAEGEYVGANKQTAAADLLHGES